jgi:hypothetical protein
MSLPKGASILATALAILIALSAAQPVSAEQRVRIIAGESGSYHLEQQIFAAQGDVEVHVDGAILYGDILYADLATGAVTLEGSVRLLQDDQELKGDFLAYNLETGIGTFDKAQAEIVVPHGLVYVSGQSVIFDEEKYNLSQVSFTTCDLEKSHYRLVTKEMEFIPGKKAVIRHVTYYEGSIPLFYWPYLVIPLDRDWDDYPFNMPVLGYSEHEGYFIKTTFSYYFNPNSHGHIYADLYSRLGVGAGVKHNYRSAELGEGFIYLWGIPTAQEPTYRAALEHSLTKNSWSFTTKNSVEKTWIRDQIDSDTRLNIEVDDLKGKLWLTHKKAPESTTKEQTDVGMEWSKKLTDRLTLNAKGSYTQKRTTDEVRLMDYMVSAVYSSGKHTLTLLAEQQFNPDLLDSSSQDWRSVQRIPELTWSLRDLGIKSLPLQAQVVLGHYGEKPSLVTKDRVYGQLSYRPNAWRPRTGTSLSFQGDVNGAVYSDSQQQAWVYGRLALTQSLGDHLTLSSTYRRRDVWGSTPFKFDAQKPLQDLNVGLRYRKTKVTASDSTTYDFVAEKFSSLTASIGLQPNDQWNVDLYASYDLNSKTFTRFAPMVEYDGEDLDVKMGLRYKPSAKELERVDLRIALPLGSTWQVSYDSIYTPATKKFTKGQISVEKDLHCRKLALSYDHVVGRVAVQYTINAFPTLPIGWDSASGLSLFDYEDVEDIIDIKE